MSSTKAQNGENCSVPRILRHLHRTKHGENEYIYLWSHVLEQSQNPRKRVAALCTATRFLGFYVLTRMAMAIAFLSLIKYRVISPPKVRKQPHIPCLL